MTYLQKNLSEGEAEIEGRYLYVFQKSHCFWKILNKKFQRLGATKINSFATTWLKNHSFETIFFVKILENTTWHLDLFIAL